MSQSVRVRFAPSPTGYLHVGGARTALFNWLYARHHGGTFVLRVEDTDEARNTQEAKQAILDGMRWLGMDWDEGPEVGGNYGPYFQSERREVYDRYFAKLEAAGRTYAEENGAMRFKFSREPITIPDMVCGDIQFAATEEPDMTIRRPDGSYIFHFVNVVDDIEMGITHVIRGEDHISNTWKHIDLFRALGAEPPQYGHIPLLLNPSGSKMSKRDEGSSIASYQEAGFLPEAVFNYLCLLGWTPEQEIFSSQDAIGLFNISDIHHSNARFDMTKCAWVNAQHLRAASPEKLAEYALPFLQKAGLNVFTPAEIEAQVQSVKEKVSLLTELPAWVHFFFDTEYAYEEEVITKLKGNAQAPAILASLKTQLGASDWSADSIAAALAAVAQEVGVKAGAVMPVLRFSLSGQSRGPDVKVILNLLGQTESLRRFDRTAALLA